MKKTDQNIGYALAWYKPEQWESLKAVSIDGDTLEESFIAWETKAKERIPEYEKEGVHLEKMIIDVDGLVAWCRTRSIPVDGAARAKYAAELLRNRDN